jgi:hypothetical protein
MATVGMAQSGESSSNPAPAAQEQTTTSVQARIKLRREQRREQAIKDAYSHLYDASISMGYQRFNLSNHLQRVTEYSWVGDFTRYFGDKVGVTLDGRGNYGTAFIQPKKEVDNISHPAINQYSGMIGPVYRFYRTPRYSVSGRVLGGISYGNFSGDFQGDQANSTASGLYPDGAAFAANAGILGEYNITPNLAARLVGEENFTGYGSSIQANTGFTLGLAYRWGKQ